MSGWFTLSRSSRILKNTDKPLVVPRNLQADEAFGASHSRQPFKLLKLTIATDETVCGGIMAEFGF